MNNGLTESENALNCILENYINESQRNTCDDDEEDKRIYQEKIDYITSQKEIVFKYLEILEILKKHCDFSLWGDDLNILAKEEYNTEYDSSVYTSVRIPNEEDRKAIKEWLESDN